MEIYGDDDLKEEKKEYVEREEFDKCVDLMVKMIGILTSRIQNLETKVWDLEHEVLTLRFLR